VRLFKLIVAAALTVACVLTVACGGEGERELVEAPRSLAGTDVDGRFVFDADGELVVDAGVQRSFDYFLTADGELGPEELDAWVAEQLRAELGDGPAHQQVMDAWYAYRMFRATAAAVLEDPTLAEQGSLAERRLLAALALQLGDTAIATAERERIVQGFALHRAAQQTDPRARAAELARLSAEEAQRFADSRAGRYLAGREAVERARLAQADAETIDELRKQHFDAIEPGAASRLAALDAKRAAWTQRLEEFQHARERLGRRLVGASSAELESAIAALEAEHFSATERRRIRAIDRMRAAE
jgi:lipase chaperone LimK